MKKIIVIGLVLALCLFITACSTDNDNMISEEIVTQNAEALNSGEMIVEESPSLHGDEIDSDGAIDESGPVLTGTFDSVMAMYSDNELAKGSFGYYPVENIALLDEWVEHYRQGIPGEVAVFLDGMGYPSGLYILESDGSPTYSITVYSSAISQGETEQRPPQIYESSLVVKRKYDYVFGADFPAVATDNWDDGRRHSILIYRSSNINFYEPEQLQWNPTTDMPLTGITPQDAERRAEEVNERLSRYVSVTQGISAAGVYLRENVLAEADADSVSELYGDRYSVYFKTVGAIRIGGEDFYIVYGHSDLEALIRGEYGGNSTAVSLDGRLAFRANEAHGGWYFVDDAEQEIIVP